MLLLLHRSRNVLLSPLLLLLLPGEYPCIAAVKAGDALHMRTLVQTRGWLLTTGTLLKLHVDGFRLSPSALQGA
jgi:hypothetical protein